MNGSMLTPETYEQLKSSGYRYLALNAVNINADSGVEFVYTVLRNMPFSFAQSLTSLQDDMIKGVVFGNTSKLAIHVLFPEEEFAIAA